MRVFHITGSAVGETAQWPATMPEQGFVWVAFSRREFEVHLAEAQAALQRLTGQTLLDLHVSDLLNNHLPSHYDYTSQYDVVVFRRLAAGSAERDVGEPGALVTMPQKLSGPPVLRRIDTSPVGFALFDRLLLTVHPADCLVREQYAARLLAIGGTAANAAAGGAAVAENGNGEARLPTRLPSSSADLMMRLINHMVDSYLALRRELTRQLDHWQAELLDPNTRFTNWKSLLDARTALHALEEVCEDQRSAVQEWIDALEEWPAPTTPAAQRERDALKVRSRDVLEHIERVVHHVRSLEASAESAVQMHFSAVAHRTNDIMRVLTAITAVFMPLNLITGIFGMNFEGMPLVHEAKGFAVVTGLMILVLALAVLLAWRKRFLS
jgi:Mg2+ and Co2+ transporter CorA